MKRIYSILTLAIVGLFTYSAQAQSFYELTAGPIITAAPAVTPTMVDISATGTFPGTLVGTGDDIAFAAALPFSFPLIINGATVTTTSNWFVTTNGLISTTSTSGITNLCPLPSASTVPGGNSIYVFNDDLNVVSGSGTIMRRDFAVGAAGHPGHPWLGTGIACTVFMWDNVIRFGGTQEWDMWAILYANGEMTFLYGPNTGTGGITAVTATIGVQAGTGGPGVQFGSCNVSSSVTPTFPLPLPAGSSVAVFYGAPLPLAPGVAAIPTTSQWGLLIIGLSFLAIGMVVLRELQSKKVLA